MHLFFALFIAFTLYNCVGEDVINDRVEEEIRVLNSVDSIEASEAHQIEVRFFNNVGEEQDVEIDWSSENPLIATVDNTGLVIGVSEGSTNIVAKATVDSQIIENRIPITITPNTSIPSVIVVPELGEITITNPVASINVSELHVFNAVYANDLGETEDIDFTWNSDNTSVATINENGVVSGISAGSAVITVTGIVNGEVIEETTSINIIEIAEVLIEKSGVIATTTFYDLEGDFTLSEIENSNDLELSIASNYIADDGLPGLYVYLTNNPNTINNALEIGAVTTFRGAHSYTIRGVDINDYAYVLYFCKPFGVKVGDGRINN